MSSHIPFRADPMLATPVSESFDKPGAVYEEKYDGDRVLAYKEESRVLLLPRNGKERTERFAGIAAASPVNVRRPLTAKRACVQPAAVWRILSGGWLEAGDIRLDTTWRAT